MGTKKGKGTPYQSEALLPVIFSTTVVIIVLAIYPQKAKVTLYQTEQLSPCLCPLPPLGVLSIARNPLALLIVD
jgi:hypothetical protein